MSSGSELADECDHGDLAATLVRLRADLGEARAEQGRLGAALQAVIAAGALLDPTYAEAWPSLRQAIYETGSLAALRATHSAREAERLAQGAHAPPEAPGASQGVSGRAADEPGLSPMDEARGAVIAAIITKLPPSSDVGGIAQIAVETAWRYAGRAAIRETAQVVEIVPIPPLNKVTRIRVAGFLRDMAERFFRQV